MFPITSPNTPSLRFAGHMADPGWCLHGKGEMLSFKPQSHTDQTDQDRDLHQGADDRSKGGPRVDTEDSYGHGNGQFEVVGSGSESQGGGALMRGLALSGA